MKIVILVEGQTEKCFFPCLRGFLEKQLVGRMPKLRPDVYDGRLPKNEKLRRKVELLLCGSADHVIALTDVYTGTADFADAEDAKRKMRTWVGPNDRFHPHTALHDFEAWLIPYWPAIQKLARHNKSAPPGTPESINHNCPPSRHIQEIFRVGQSPRDYIKTRDAKAILEGQDLSVAIACCPELKAFVNTILTLSGGVAL
ncbi:MAG: DUF4276 family protein [Bryobacteraceae bacterium]|nr:DUF4276 family protein [Bryobacteraceae bacterium]